MTLLRFINTLRYLKFKQIYYRYINNKRKKTYTRRPEKYTQYFRKKASQFFRDISSLTLKTKGTCNGSAGPQGRERYVSPDNDNWLVRGHADRGMYNAEDLLENRFRFLNREKELDPENIWPRHEDMPLLWDFNLHYFEYVMLLNREGHQNRAVDLIRDWIDKNPFRAEPAWAQYTVSLRLRNWAKFFIGNPDLLTEEIARSMAFQTAYLAENCEYHLLANHLLENLITLVFMGLFFGTIELINEFEPLLERELREQTDTSGSHCEGSFMYHLLLLEALADLHQMYKTAGRTFLTLETCIKKWGGYLSRVVSRSGIFPLFGDAATGIAADPLKLHAYVSNVVDIPEIHAENRIIDAGGLVICEKDDIYLAVNAQDPAPSYNPGHRHSDLCAFELYYRSQPIIIDSGVFGYEESSGRLTERSTAAHNTVTADRCEIHDVWGSFRMGRRSSASAVEIDSVRNRITTGYKNRHIEAEREIKVTGSTLTVSDTVKGMKKDFETRFHFPAEFNLREESQGVFILKGDHVNMRVSFDPGLKTFAEPFQYSREFGQHETGMCLTLKGTVPQQTYILEITPPAR